MVDKKTDPEFQSVEGIKGLKGLNYKTEDESDLYGRTPTIDDKRLKQYRAKIRSEYLQSVASIPDKEYIGDLYPEAGKSRYDYDITEESQLQNLNTFRSEQQSGLLKAFNTVFTGVVGGLATAAQDIAYMTDLNNYLAFFDSTKKIEDNIVSSAMKDIKQQLYDFAPVYETTAESPLGQFFKFSTLRGILDSVIGFAIPGVIAGKAASLAVKGASYGLRLARASKYADMMADAMNVTGKAANTAEDSYKIAHRIINADDYATSVIGGLISNQAEGVMMAIEESDNIKNRYIEDRAAKILMEQSELNGGRIPTEEEIENARQLATNDFNNNKELQIEIGKRQKDFINNNRAFFLTDAFGIHGLFKAGRSLASRELRKPPKTLLQGLKTFGPDNLLLQGATEGFEEMGQQGIQQEFGYLVGDKFDFKTPEQEAVENKTKLGRILSFTTSDQAIVEGLMGFVSGGAQRAFMQFGADLANGDPMGKKRKAKYQELYDQQQELIKSYTENSIKEAMQLQDEIGESLDSKASKSKIILSNIARQSGFFRNLSKAFENGTTESLENQLIAVSKLTEEQAAAKGFTTVKEEQEARKNGDIYTKSYKTLSEEWLKLLKSEEQKYNTLLHYKNAGRLINLSMTINYLNSVLNDLNADINQIKTSDSFINGIVDATNLDKSRAEVQEEINEYEKYINKIIQTAKNSSRKTEADISILEKKAKEALKQKKENLEKYASNSYYRGAEGSELIVLESTVEDLKKQINSLNKEYNHISSLKYQLSFDKRREKIAAAYANMAKRASEEYRNNINKTVNDIKTDVDSKFQTKEEKIAAVNNLKETAVESGDGFIEEAATETIKEILAEGEPVNEERAILDTFKTKKEFFKNLYAKINPNKHKILLEESAAIEKFISDSKANNQPITFKRFEDTFKDAKKDKPNITTSMLSYIKDILDSQNISEKMPDEIDNLIEIKETEWFEINNTPQLRTLGPKSGKVAYTSRSTRRKDNIYLPLNTFSPDFNHYIFTSPYLKVGTPLIFKLESDSQKVTVGFDEDSNTITNTWGAIKNKLTEEEKINLTPIGIYVKVNGKLIKIGYVPNADRDKARNQEEYDALVRERKFILNRPVKRNIIELQAQIQDIDNGVISKKSSIDENKFSTVSELENKDLRVVIFKGNTNRSSTSTLLGKGDSDFNIADQEIINGKAYLVIPRPFNNDHVLVGLIRKEIDTPTQETVKFAINTFIKLNSKQELSPQEITFLNTLHELSTKGGLASLKKDFIIKQNKQFIFSPEHLKNFLRLFINVTNTEGFNLKSTIDKKVFKNQDTVLNAISIDRLQNKDKQNLPILSITIANNKDLNVELEIHEKGFIVYRENGVEQKDKTIEDFIDELSSVLPTFESNVDANYVRTSDSKISIPFVVDGKIDVKDYNSYQEYIKNNLLTDLLETTVSNAGERSFNYFEQRQILYRFIKDSEEIQKNSDEVVNQLKEAKDKTSKIKETLIPDKSDTIKTIVSKTGIITDIEDDEAINPPVKSQQIRSQSLDNRMKNIFDSLEEEEELSSIDLLKDSTAMEGILSFVLSDLKGISLITDNVALISPKQQEEFIEFLVNSIIPDVIYDLSEDGNTISTSNIKEYLNQIKSYIEKAADNIKTNTPRKLHMMEYLNNWNYVEQIVINKILNISGINSRVNPDSLSDNITGEEDANKEFEGVDAAVDKKSFEDDYFLSLNYNNIASTKMRLLLYGLIDDSKSFYLLPKAKLAVDVETVYNTLHLLLSDLPADYTKMKQVMMDNYDKFPWLVDLVNKLDNNEELRGQFTRIMHTYTVNMKKIIDRGNNTLEVIDSNSNSLYYSNLQEWNTNFKDSDLVRVNSKGNIVYSNSGINRFIKFLGLVVQDKKIITTTEGFITHVNDDNYDKERLKKEFRIFLEFFNINLSNKLIDDLINGNYRLKSNDLLGVPFKTLFNKNNQLFSQLISRVIRQEPIEKIFSGSLLKNLIIKNAIPKSTSFWSKDKSITGISYPMYITDRTNKLKSVDENGKHEFAEYLSTFAFEHSSYILKGLVENSPAFVNTLNYFHLDLSPYAIAGAYSPSLEYKDLSETIQYKIRLSCYFNNGTTIDGMRIANMFYPTMGDKKNQVLISVPIPDIPTDTEQLKQFLFDNIVIPELNRMYYWKQTVENTDSIEEQKRKLALGEDIINRIIDLENFNEGANVFFRIPELNTITDLFIDTPSSIKDKLNGIEDGLGDRIKRIVNPDIFAIGTDSSKKLFDKIKDITYQVVSREISNQITAWNNAEIGLTDETTPYKEFSVFDFKNIPVGYINYIQNKTGYNTNKDILEAIASDYVINNMVVQGEFEQLYTSDMADYMNKEAVKELNKETPNYYNVVKAVDINRSKRLSGDKAIKYYGDYSENPVINVIFFQDVKSLPAILDYYEKLGFSQRDLSLDGSLVANTTDGAVFTSIDEHLNNMVFAGNISKEEKTRILNKYYSNEELDYKDLNIVLNPLKPVYNSKEVSYGYNSKQQKIFFKYASVPLLKQFTKGGNLELDNLRRLVERHHYNSENLPIDMIVFSSAAKTGLPLKSNQLKVDDLNEATDEFINSKIYSIPRDGLGIQLDKPFDEFKHTIRIGAQETSALFSKIRNIDGFKYNGKSYKGSELEKIYVSLYKDLFKSLRSKLEKQLLSEDGKYVNVEKLQKLIFEEGIARGYSLNTLLGLELDGSKTNFKMPLWLSAESEKIEALIISLINNRILKTKTTGKGFILQSDYGVWEKMSSEDQEKILKDIIFTSSWDGKKLKGRRFENGKVLPAQIIIRSVFTDAFGNTFDIYDYLDKLSTIDENGRKVIDLEKVSKVLPQEILKGFGFRIPTQGYSGMSLVEIVGILPKIYGDTVIACQDFITQMGLDFDIDVLYTYLYKTAVLYNREDNLPKVVRLDKISEQEIHSLAKSKILREIKSSNPEYRDYSRTELETVITEEFNDRYNEILEDLKDSVEEAKILNSILDIHLSVGEHDDSNHSVQKLFSKLLDYGGMEDGSETQYAKKIEEDLLTIKGIPTISYLTPEHQFNSYNRANASKSAIGAFATIFSLGNDIFEKFDTPLQFMDIVNDTNIFSINIDGYKSNGKLFIRTSKEFTPLDILNSFLSVAVDDEKLRVFPRLNVNDNTLPSIIGIAALGYPLNSILEIINNPFVIDYIKTLKLENLHDPTLNPRMPNSKVLNKVVLTTFINVLGEKRGSQAFDNIKEDITSINFYKGAVDTNILANIRKKGIKSESDIINSVNALIAFLKTMSVGNKLFSLRKHSNMISKFLPNNFLEIQKLSTDIENIIKNELKNGQQIHNAHQLFGQYENNKFIFNTIVGHIVEEALIPATTWFNNIFPYTTTWIENIIDNIADAFGIRASDITILYPNFYKELIRGLKAFIYSNNSLLGVDDVNALRYALTHGNKETIVIERPDPVIKNKTYKDIITGYREDNIIMSLGDMLKAIQPSEYYQSNKFLNILYTSTEGNITTVGINNTSGERLNDANIFSDFVRLISDNQDIVVNIPIIRDGTKKTISYTINTRDLATKLIQYSFLVNLSVKKNSFSKYIPNNLLFKLGVDFILNNSINEMSTKDKIDSFVTQFIQHYAERIPNYDFNTEDYSFIQTGKIEDDTILTVFSAPLFSSPFLRITYPKNKHIMSVLYKLNYLTGLYEAIPTLSRKENTEFNFNKEIGISINDLNNINTIPDSIETSGALPKKFNIVNSEPEQLTIDNLLSNISKNGLNPIYKTLADRLSKVISNSTTVIYQKDLRNSLNQSVKGLYKNGVIYIREGLFEKDYQETLLHESIHAVLKDHLNSNNPEIAKLVGRLKNILKLYNETINIDILKKAFPGADISKLQTVFIDNMNLDSKDALNEFIAQAMSSENFRNVLNDAGLWTKIKTIILKIAQNIGIISKEEFNDLVSSIKKNKNLVNTIDNTIFAILNLIENEQTTKKKQIETNQYTNSIKYKDSNLISNILNKDEIVIINELLNTIGIEDINSLSDSQKQIVLEEFKNKSPQQSITDLLGEINKKLCK